MNWKRIRIVVLGRLVGWLHRFLNASLRPVVVGEHSPELLAKFDGAERVILAFWHGQLGMFYRMYRGPGLSVMISRHADGEIIARGVAPLGIEAVRGSATRGRIGGLRGMLRAWEKGRDLAFVVDGPRGPRHKVKLGVVQLARVTGAPIWPVACAPRRGRVFRRSWDHFTVPFPFTRVWYQAGNPVRVPPEASTEQMEQARQQLEAELLHVTANVERYARQGTA